MDDKEVAHLALEDGGGLVVPYLFYFVDCKDGARPVLAFGGVKVCVGVAVGYFEAYGVVDVCFEDFMITVY